MTTTPTASDIARRNHRHVVRFFWTWLAIATLVSLAGNVAHAWITAPPNTRPLAASVASVAPVALLLSIHGLAVLAKATASGAVYRTSVAATAALALGAFLLSFVALRDLAMLAGIRPSLAPALPLVIDLAIAVATLALVAVGDKPARRGRTAARGANESLAAPATPKTATATASLSSGANASRDIATPRKPDTATSVADEPTRQLAATLVAEKITRQPVEAVARILVAHAQGDPLNRIAKNLGVHHSAVLRIIEAAAARDRRPMAVA